MLTSPCHPSADPPLFYQKYPHRGEDPNIFPSFNYSIFYKCQNEVAAHHSERNKQTMSKKIVQLNEEVIKSEQKEPVRGSIRVMRNDLLEKETESLIATGLKSFQFLSLQIFLSFSFHMQLYSYIAA